MKLGVMRFGIHMRRRLAVAAAIASVAIGVPVGAVAASAPHTATVAQCNNNNTYVWFADAPNGTAGPIYYPVEFTNIGKSTCTLYGYPGVSAVNTNLKQVGAAAARVRSSRSTVTLKPGQTANAMLSILPKGFLPGCKTAAVDGLFVYPPNETGGQFVLNFSFWVCKNKSTLRISPVTSGIGVP